MDWGQWYREEPWPATIAMLCVGGFYLLIYGVIPALAVWGLYEWATDGLWECRWEHPHTEFSQYENGVRMIAPADRACAIHGRSVCAYIGTVIGLGWTFVGYARLGIGAGLAFTSWLNRAHPAPAPEKPPKPTAPGSYL
jgi:hypothetical protein